MPWHIDKVNGAIDWSSGTAKRQLMVAFSRLDRNADGVLDFWEMERYLHNLHKKPHGHHKSPQELKAIFDSIDADGDGVLDFSEFEAFMRDKPGTQQLLKTWPGTSRGRLTMSQTLLPGAATSAQGKVLPDVSWSTSVPVPDAYVTRGAYIEQTELRGITVQQLKDFADLVESVLSNIVICDARSASTARVTQSSVNMYHLDSDFV